MEETIKLSIALVWDLTLNLTAASFQDSTAELGHCIYAKNNNNKKTANKVDHA